MIIQGKHKDHFENRTINSASVKIRNILKIFDAMIARVLELLKTELKHERYHSKCYRILNINIKLLQWVTRMFL
jgi:hypothetical protein